MKFHYSRRYCPNGHCIDDEQLNYCPECGMPLSNIGNNQVSNTTSTIKHHSSHVGYIILGVIILILSFVILELTNVTHLIPFLHEAEYKIDLFYYDQDDNLIERGSLPFKKGSSVFVEAKEIPGYYLFSESPIYVASLEDGSPEYLNVSFGYQRIGDSESESISNDSYSPDQSSDTQTIVELSIYDELPRLGSVDINDPLSYSSTIFDMIQDSSHWTSNSAPQTINDFSYFPHQLFTLRDEMKNVAFIYEFDGDNYTIKTNIGDLLPGEGSLSAMMYINGEFCEYACNQVDSTTYTLNNVGGGTVHYWKWSVGYYGQPYDNTACITMCFHERDGRIYDPVTSLSVTIVYGSNNWVDIIYECDEALTFVNDFYQGNTPRHLLQYDMHGRLYAFDSTETLYPLAEKVFGF